MTWLSALPWLALAAGIAALAAQAFALRRPNNGQGPAPNERAALAVAAGATIVAFLGLALAFLRADLSLQSVFLYSRSDLEWQWKLAGTWAGREGSLLLWTMWLTVVAWLVSWRHRTTAVDAVESRARTWTRLALTAILVAFLAAVALQDTFAGTPDYLLQGRPLGNGLNPTLKSPYILIHPPLMFLAYALATVPAAAALGHMASGTDRWSSVAMQWARWDWVLYAVAMTLGALWAYVTLGFGGYWAWDPVEVANLLPFIALSLYLHAQLQHHRHGAYRTAGPFLALLPFALTLFSTISTRSGLWVSVHAFTDPTNTFNPDPAARFLDIMSVETGLATYVGLFGALWFFGLGLWCFRLSREHGKLRALGSGFVVIGAGVAALFLADARWATSLLLESSRLAGFSLGTGAGLLLIGFGSVALAAAPSLAGPATAWRARLDNRGFAAYAVGALGVGLLVLFLFHLAATLGWSTAFYEARVPMMAAPLVVGMTAMVARPLGKRASLVAPLVALALAGIGAVAALRTGWPWQGGFVVALGLPLAALGFRAAFVMPPKAHRLRAGIAVAAFLFLLWYALGPSYVPGIGPFEGIFVLAATAAALVGLMLAVQSSARSGGASPAAARGRVHTACLYGLHGALGLLLVGYGASTYFATTTELEGPLFAGAQAGPHEIQWGAVDATRDAPTPFAAEYTIWTQIDGADFVPVTLTYEAGPGAYYPLPARYSWWDGDVYLNVRSITFADGSCADEVVAYQAGPRPCTSDAVTSASMDVKHLPGLGLVWTATVLLTASMVGWMMSRKEEPAGNVLEAAPSATSNGPEG